MSSKLAHYLAKLAVNADEHTAFMKDKEGAAKRAGLDAEDISALTGDDPCKVFARLTGLGAAQSAAQAGPPPNSYYGPPVYYGPPTSYYGPSSSYSAPPGSSVQTSAQQQVVHHHFIWTPYTQQAMQSPAPAPAQGRGIFVPFNGGPFQVW